jgi:hypothetical protein
MTEETDDLPGDKQSDSFLKQVHELHESRWDWAYASVKRGDELHESGLDRAYASGLAGLEQRINAWPSAWGDDLWILIYGDFEPPSVDLHFPPLGITVHHEKLEKTVVRSASCVLRATVTISKKSVPAIIDATRRINVLLGAWTLIGWGTGACGWWSYVTHEFHGGVLTKPAQEDLDRAIRGVVNLPTAVRQKFDAALYWVREPRNLLSASHQSDHLKIYAAYWNAFECLVDAVNLIHPPDKMPRDQKQRLIDKFIAERNGKLTAKDIEECHRIVNPGQVGKAKHALGICFPEDYFPGLAKKYASECFEIPNTSDQLYQIRNNINHGNVDAENPSELVRISARLDILWIIVWQMMARFVSCPAPAPASIDIMKQ